MCFLYLFCGEVVGNFNEINDLKLIASTHWVCVCSCLLVVVFSFFHMLNEMDDLKLTRGLIRLFIFIFSF